MTRYLMIENKGIAPQEAFEILGLSDSREDSVKIGQFGSGAKMSIILLLRAGLNPVVTSDSDTYAFYTEHTTSKLGNFDRVCYRHSNSEGTVENTTSYSTGAGELDWAEEGMAIREFISNALDQSDQKWDKIKVEYADEVESRKGYTRIFVPLNKAITDYVVNLRKYFLHLDNNEKETIFIKDSPSYPRLYRQGVFVKKLTRRVSLLDYNGDSGMKIDESRNLDSSSMESHCVKILNSAPKAMKYVVGQLADNTRTFFESEFSSFMIDSSHAARAFTSLYGESAVITDNSILKERLAAKGILAIEFPYGWCQAMADGGITRANSMLSSLEQNGIKAEPADLSQRGAFDKVWHCLVDEGLTHGKDKPGVKVFNAPMEGGSQLGGLQEGKTVYLHVNHVDNVQTVLEEISHYITGANDCSRDFQDFAFKIAAYFMSKEQAQEVSSSIGGINLTEY